MRDRECSDSSLDGNISIASDHSADGVVVAIPPADAISSFQSTSSSLILNAIDHFLSTFRIFLVTTALAGRWLHQLFLQLEYYNAAPSKEAQQTWLAVFIMSVTATASVGLEFLNYWYAKKNPRKYLAAQDYVFEAFSSSMVLLFLDVMSSSGQIGVLPMPWFVAITAVGVPVVTRLLYELTLPDSSDQFIFSSAQFSAFNPSRYLDARKFERVLNFIPAIVTYAGPSAATLFSVIDREMNGEKTVPLQGWEKGSISFYLLFAAFMGFELTHYPKLFQLFVAFSKLIKEGALSYLTLSALFFTYVVYHCTNRTFCADSHTREALTGVSFFIASGMGIYSAARTRFRFEENHASNLRIMAMIDSIPDKSRVACARVTQFFKESCSRKQPARMTDDTALLYGTH